MALGHDAVVPSVLKPSEPAGLIPSGAVVGPGAGDNAAVALGVDQTGDVIISIGTSGVVSAVADSPIADPTGEVVGSADATGRFLQVASTPIAARVSTRGGTMLVSDIANSPDWRYGRLPVVTDSPAAIF